MNISYPIKEEEVFWDPLLLMRLMVVLHAADDSVIQLHIFECYISGKITLLLLRNAKSNRQLN